MKSCLKRVLVAAVVVLACCAAAGSARAQGAEAPLTNGSVVKLVRAGFREKTVIAIIRSRPARFDLAPERLIELKKGGVSERVILAMLAREEANGLANEDWEEDGFFDEGGGVSKSPQPGGEPGGGVGIFGSSGGARGRTRSRGGSGGGDTDTQTLGSASVKIIRPPVEPGAEAKLERTPTLNNNKVVELVEAGFSEGTIIRRIEQSPVEFDLTPAKLAELRKRRVTEPVIAAMRAAMGEEGEQPARPER
jgi:hypothetical protein